MVRRKFECVSAKSQAQKRLLDDKNRMTKADIIVKTKNTELKCLTQYIWHDNTYIYVQKNTDLR